MVEAKLPDIPQGIMVEMEGSGQEMDDRVKPSGKVNVPRFPLDDIDEQIFSALAKRWTMVDSKQKTKIKQRQNIIKVENKTSWKTGEADIRTTITK